MQLRHTLFSIPEQPPTAYWFAGQKHLRQTTSPYMLIAFPLVLHFWMAKEPAGHWQVLHMASDDGEHGDSSTLPSGQEQILHTMSDVEEHGAFSILPAGHESVHGLHTASAWAVHADARYSPLGHELHAAHWMLLLVVQAEVMYWPEGHEVEQAVQARGEPAVHGPLTYCPLGHSVPHGRQALAALLPAGEYVPPGQAVQVTARDTRGAHRKPMKRPW